MIKHIVENDIMQNPMDISEEQIPTMAKDIFMEASQETLESGQSILKVIGNNIYKIYPNGKQVKIKKTKASIRIKSKHQKLTLI